MAFHAFNFGKQLGLIGHAPTGESSELPVLIGRMEDEYLNREASGLDNPLDPRTRFC